MNQKSELQKAMEKHKGKQALKEQEKEKQNQMTPLQRAIDERAQRLEKVVTEFFEGVLPGYLVLPNNLFGPYVLS